MTRDTDLEGSAAAERSNDVTKPALVLPTGIRDDILERARDGQPAEICGVFGGDFNPNRSRVRSCYLADNVADTPRTRYRIDPEEQLAIFDALEARGEDIVGFYHSHPRGPPRPSATDTAQATWSERSYLIVSLEPQAVGSWRWRAAAEAGKADETSEAAGETDETYGAAEADETSETDEVDAGDDDATSESAGRFERERLVLE